MDILAIFKVAQLLVLAVFIVFISDVRAKPKTNTLMKQKLLIILKIAYVLLLTVYVYSLLILSYLSPFDFLALCITTIATTLTISAKITLADKHTWTGYCLKSNCFIAKGIYAYIRHPIYTGIYLFIVGAAVTMLLHTTMLLNALAVLSLSVILPFLAIAAKKETKFLTQQHGNSFLRYQKLVHPFLPIKKYHSTISK